MKIICFVAFLLIIQSVLYAQQPPTKRQETIQQTVVKMFNALSNRDSVSLKKYCAADITLYEYGQVWNIDTLILKAITLNPAADFNRTNTFDFINITVDKATAWITYRLQSAIAREGKLVTMQWLETVFLIKERKEWKIKHLHSTLIKRS